MNSFMDNLQPSMRHLFQSMVILYMINIRPYLIQYDKIHAYGGAEVMYLQTLEALQETHFAGGVLSSKQPLQP